MSRKHFSWLFFMTFLVAALVIVMPGKTGRESIIEQEDFLPELAMKANDLKWLRLTAAGGAVIGTFRREEDSWVVEEASGYRANWDLLKNLLAGLAQARVIELKTDNPEYYVKLGVEDVTLAEASGVMIEFDENTGLPAVIVGNNARARDGQYARLKDSAQSVLLDSSINLPGDPIAWLDREIIDISDAEVVEFGIEHTDGESVKALKISAGDENFKLQHIPEGREIKSEYSVNAPANALAALDMEAVTPATELEWKNGVRFVIVTADGLTVDSELISIENGDGEESESEHWLRLRAGLYTTALGSQADAAQDHSETTSRAAEINHRVEGWAYRIPKYKYDTMTRRMEDMLASADE